MRWSILSALFLSISCLPQNYSAQWLTKQSAKPLFTIDRKPAQDTECFVDSWDHAKVRRQIRQLEKVFERSERNLNQKYALASNTAQHFYLDKLVKNSAEVTNYFKQCEDFDCYVNSPYQDNSLTAGARIYHWFLSTGQILQAGERQFGKDELAALSQVAGALPSFYLHSGIDYLVASNSSQTLLDDNRIYLAPAAITLGNKSFEGEFYQAIFKLYSAGVDRLGSQRGLPAKYSLNPDWLEGSWKVDEGVERGITHFKFVYDMAKSPWRSSSVNFNHPSEEFSKVLSDVFLNPEIVKANDPKRYQFLVETFYHGEGLDLDSLSNRFRIQLQAALSEHFPIVVKNCYLKNEGDLTLSFSQQCADDRLEKIVGELIAQAKLKEYSGCKFWNTDKKLGPELVEWAKQSLKQNIASHGLNLYTLENYSEQKNHLKQKMMASCDPRAILFIANQSSEPEKTYQSNLQLCLERFVGQDKNLFELVNLEIKGSYPFTKVKEELDRQLHGLLKTMEPVIEKSSVALIHECTKSKSDSLLLTPFSGGSIFVESNVLTCINNRINKEIDQLLKGQLKNDYKYAGAGITYIESLLLPKYLNKLQYAIKQIHANEKMAMSTLELSTSEMEEQFYQKYSSRLNEEASDFFPQCHNMIDPELTNIIRNKVQNAQNTITIAFHEEASKIGQDYCFMIKTKKLTERGLELAYLESELKEFTDKVNLADARQWFYLVKNEMSWEKTCSEQVKTQVLEQVNHLFERKFKYYTRQKVLRMGVTKLCEGLKREFKEQFKDFDQKLVSVDLANKYSKIITADLLWMRERSEQKMFNRCVQSYQALLTAKQVEPTYHYLSNSIKALLVAKQICHRGKMAWNDLNQALHNINPSCVINCWETIANKISEYFVSLNQTVWQFLDQAKDKKLIQSLIVRMDKILDQQIEFCQRDDNSIDNLLSKRCLDRDVFIPQNFSKIVKDIYPPKKRMLPEHLQKLDERFKQRASNRYRNIASGQ